MDQLITLLKEKTGVDDATAHKIVAFIQEHLQDLPALLQGDQKSGGLGGLMDAAKGFLGGNESE